MTVVLAVESATDAAGVAVADDSGLLAAMTVGRGRRHAETIAPAVAAVCRSGGVELADLTAVAVDVGPGLFTGLRVGIATATGLAFALGVPVVPVLSLDVLAAAAAAVPYPARPLVAVVDARRGEVFWAWYQPAPGVGAEETTTLNPAGAASAPAGAAGAAVGPSGAASAPAGAASAPAGAAGAAGAAVGPSGTAMGSAGADGRADEHGAVRSSVLDGVPPRTHEPRVGPPEAVAAEMASRAAIGPAPVALGDGARRYADVLIASGGAVAGPFLAHPPVAALAGIGVARAAAGQVAAPEAVSACYLRDADARINWERR